MEKLKLTKSFIKQTAKDYELPIKIVEDIVKNYPDNLYEKLEECIVERNKI